MRPRQHPFTFEGIPVPVITVRGGPGTVWPEAGPLRLAVRSPGVASARLRAYGAAGVAAVTARRVVDGVPTGPEVDIGATDGFDLPEGELCAFDLRVTIAARAPGQLVERPVALVVDACEPGGWA